MGVCGGYGGWEGKGGNGCEEKKSEKANYKLKKRKHNKRYIRERGTESGGERSELEVTSRMGLRKRKIF